MRTLFDFAKTLIAALLIALLITSFFKPTLVKGLSMYPTIQPNNYLIISKIPYMQGMPEYGDIIVFEASIVYEGGESHDLIKRVIGLPGDSIAVHDGIVFRNGEPLEEPYINGGETPGDMDDVTVTAGHVFVMGDNRSVSLDSRDPSIGAIPMDKVLGKAALRLFPFEEIGTLE